MTLIPPAFCWTRFGTEAGQSVQEILRRKEEERLANGGVFLWGVGNALSPAIRALVAMAGRPLLLLSPTVSTPRRVDAAPSSVALWTEATDLAGEPYDLPQRSLVTSHLSGAAGKRFHYALVCRSSEPLDFGRVRGYLDFASLFNLQSGKPIGASQVTCVVQHRSSISKGRRYPIVYAAELAPPFLVRLSRPMPITRVDSNLPWGHAVEEEWTRRRQLPPIDAPHSIRSTTA